MPRCQLNGSVRVGPPACVARSPVIRSLAPLPSRCCDCCWQRVNSMSEATAAPHSTTLFAVDGVCVWKRAASSTLHMRGHVTFKCPRQYTIEADKRLYRACPLITAGSASKSGHTLNEPLNTLGGNWRTVAENGASFKRERESVCASADLTCVERKKNIA